MKQKLSKYKDVNILSIIHCNDDVSLLYRDLLLWYSDTYLNLRSKEKLDKGNSASKKEFRIDEIGKWLLDNHRPFKEDYKNLHHKMSVRLHQKRDTIKKAVNNLMELGLITISKDVESDRNKNIMTKEYRFTDPGIIISWLLAIYKNQNTENYPICINMFLSSFINSFQSKDKALIYDFIKNLLDNCDKNKVIDKFIELDQYIGLFIKLIYKEDISSIRRSLLAIITLNKKLFEMFLYTLEKLDNNKKSMLLYEFKLEIESLFENAVHISDTFNTWQIIRYQNREKEDVITMVGKCPNCGIIPFAANTTSAFKLFWIFSEFYFLIGNNLDVKINSEFLNEQINSAKEKEKDKRFLQEELCSLCKKNDLKISFRIQKDVAYDQIFIHIKYYSLRELVVNKRS